MKCVMCAGNHIASIWSSNSEYTSEEHRYYQDVLSKPKNHTLLVIHFTFFINFYEGLGCCILFLHVFDSEYYHVKSTLFTL